MNRATRIALSAVGAASLAGCKIPLIHHDEAPTGQVAATYAGQEITIRQIALELGAFSTTNPKLRKAADTAALENILSRKILARAAIVRGLDKTPDYAMLRQRAEDSLLVDLLEKKLASTVPAPTADEVNSFINAHPFMFAQRKIWVVDQLRMARPADPSVLKRLQPLTTMTAVESELTRDGVHYQTGVGTIDAIDAEPNIVDQIVKLPANQIFIVPAANGQLLINQIRDTQTVPVTGQDAERFAQALLQRQHTEDAVKRQLSAIVNAGLAEVTYNKDYSPAKVQTAPLQAAPKASTQ